MVMVTGTVGLCPALSICVSLTYQLLGPSLSRYQTQRCALDADRKMNPVFC